MAADQGAPLVLPSRCAGEGRTVNALRSTSAAFLAAAIAATTAGAAFADPPPQATGAAMSLSKNVLQTGQRVFITLNGWRGPAVTISVCGNLASRGSADCNLAASQSVGTFSGSGPVSTEFTVFPPPGTCPCVIRASSATQGDVVVAPIELVDFPVGPVVDPVTGPPVEIDLRVRRARASPVATLRTALGGSTRYRLSVAVTNRTTIPLDAVLLDASVGRAGWGRGSAIGLPAPGNLAPGQRWSVERTVTVRAPVVREFVWTVGVAGVGLPVRTQAVTESRPLGLLALAAIFLVDVVAMAWMFIARRRKRTGQRSGGAARGELRPGAGGVSGPVTSAPPGHYLPFPIGVVPSPEGGRMDAQGRTAWNES